MFTIIALPDKIPFQKGYLIGSFQNFLSVFLRTLLRFVDNFYCGFFSCSKTFFFVSEVKGMTAKYYGTTHRHPFKWDEVASAIFMRYPNPFATHVLSEDTLHRELVNGDILYSRRFLTKTNRLPKWGERFFANLKKFVPLVEESHIDRGSKVM